MSLRHGVEGAPARISRGPNLNFARFSALALAVGLSSPAAALACGGFFCSSTPVDQQAERILFVDEGDDTWSAYVEIQYKGESDAFAWIVPVPEVPELDT